MDDPRQALLEAMMKQAAGYAEGQVIPGSDPDGFDLGGANAQMAQDYAGQESARGLTGAHDENISWPASSGQSYRPDMPYEYQPTVPLSPSDLRTMASPQARELFGLSPDDLDALGHNAQMPGRYAPQSDGLPPDQQALADEMQNRMQGGGRPHWPGRAGMSVR